MDVSILAQKIQAMGIETVTGIPDSTLKAFCDYITQKGAEMFHSCIVPADEGAAVGIAIGEYLSCGRPACVYLQNSGLGNAVNPLTSLAHPDVYGIPMLLLIGWRGEPGTEDEPQHSFMGKATLPLLDVLDIPYSVVDGQTTGNEVDRILSKAGRMLAQGRQYALVVKKGTFGGNTTAAYKNESMLVREDVVGMVARWLGEEDLIVSTTGKISRELYGQMHMISGSHRQAFLTVGGMGHASMIAFQIACRKLDRRVICLDGDGAVLMHMGNLAVLGAHPADNLVHICLNNRAHESVGGMPTGAADISYSWTAKAVGYPAAYCVRTEGELSDALQKIRHGRQMAFLEVMVAIGSRADLGRPKETAAENKELFMDAAGQNA